jgi:hypothetical protein
MATVSTQELVDAFTRKVQARLDPERLDGAVRLDNTRTVVIIPLKDRGPIHAHIRRGIDDDGAADVISQIECVPSLKSLVVSDKS